MSSKSVIINESGLYALVLRSRKPEARKFAKWVTRDVLPSIRKTGRYVGKPFTVNPDDVLTDEQQRTLREILDARAEKMTQINAGALAIKKFYGAGWGRLYSHFPEVKGKYRMLPQKEFTSAVSILTRYVAGCEVLDAPKKEVPGETVNETIERLANGLKAGNGCPVQIFLPLYAAIRQKMNSGCGDGRFVDADRIELAMASANATASRVQQQVFAHLLRSKEPMLFGRWLLSFDCSAQGPQPSVQPVENGNFVASLESLARYVVDPSFGASVSDLARLAAACSQRIASKASSDTRRQQAA